MNLTIETVKELVDKLPKVPRLEIHIGGGQMKRFCSSLAVHGVTLNPSRGSYVPTFLYGVPVVESLLYQPGLGSLVEFKGDRWIVMLYFTFGEGDENT